MKAQSQDRKVWIGGGVVVALLIAAASWFLMISPELDNASALRDQTASTEFGNTQLQAKVAVLKQKSEQMSKYSASLRDALETLPFDSGLPTFTRQVYAQAQSTHVKIEGITVGGITAATTTHARRNLDRPSCRRRSAGARPYDQHADRLVDDGTDRADCDGSHGRHGVRRPAPARNGRVPGQPAPFPQPGAVRRSAPHAHLRRTALAGKWCQGRVDRRFGTDDVAVDRVLRSADAG